MIRSKRKLFLSISILCLVFSFQIKPIPAIKGLFSVLKKDDIGFGQALLKSHWIENVYQYAEGVAPSAKTRFKPSEDPVANLIRSLWFRLSEDLQLVTTQRGPSLVLREGKIFGQLMNHIYTGKIFNKKVQEVLVKEWQKYYKENKSASSWGRVSKKLFTQLIDEIAKSVSYCQEDSAYLPRTTEGILWAFFCEKIAKLPVSDMVDKFKESFSEIGAAYKSEKVKITGALYSSKQIDDLDKEIKELSLEDKFKVGFEKYDLALHGLLKDEFPPAVKQGSYGYEFQKNKFSKPRPNCFETALLDFFSILWFNPQAKRYDNKLFKPEVVDSEGFTRLRNALKYLYLASIKKIEIPQAYKKDRVISYLRTRIKDSELKNIDIEDIPVGTINRNEILQEWMNIISGRNVKKIEYPYKSVVDDATKLTYHFSIKGSDKKFEIYPRVTNIINLINFMYGTEAKEITDFDKLLSIDDDRKITFKVQKKDSDDDNVINVEVQDKNIDIYWRFGLHIEPMHAWIEVPGREATGLKIYGKSFVVEMLKKVDQDGKLKEKDKYTNFLTLLTYPKLLYQQIDWNIPILNLMYYSFNLKQPMNKLAVIKDILERHMQFYQEYKPLLYHLIDALPEDDEYIQRRVEESIVLSGAYEIDVFLKQKLKKCDYTKVLARVLGDEEYISEEKVLNVYNFFKDKDFNIEDPQIFVQAVEKGYKEIVKMLLGHKDINVNAEDVYGLTVLIKAIEKGYKEIVKMLLEHKDIDVNAKGLYSDKVPLIKAIEKGYKEIVKMLLKHKDIDVNATDGRSRALIAAVEGENNEIVKMLLENKNIDLKAKDSRGESVVDKVGGTNKNEIILMIREAIKKRIAFLQEEVKRNESRIKFIQKEAQLSKEDKEKNIKKFLEKNKELMRKIEDLKIDLEFRL